MSDWNETQWLKLWQAMPSEWRVAFTAAADGLTVGVISDGELGGVRKRVCVIFTDEETAGAIYAFLKSSGANDAPLK